VADDQDDVHAGPDGADALRDGADVPPEDAGARDGGRQVLSLAEIDDPDADPVDLEDEGPAGLIGGHARPDGADGMPFEQLQGLPEGVRPVIEDVIVRERGDLEGDRRQPADVLGAALEDGAALPDRGAVPRERALQVDDAQIAPAQDRHQVAVDRPWRLCDDPVEGPDGGPVRGDDDLGPGLRDRGVDPSAPAPVKASQSGFCHPHAP